MASADDIFELSYNDRKAYVCGSSLEDLLRAGKTITILNFGVVKNVVCFQAKKLFQ